MHRRRDGYGDHHRAGLTQRSRAALAAECDALAAEIRRRAPARDRPFLDRPFMVALDGPSGAGKSSVASLLEARLGARCIPSDDFFAADITAAEWDSYDAPTRARLGIDWQRTRTEALEPLLAGRAARWHRFDWEAGLREDGTYGMRSDYSVLAPAAVLVLDGAYSSRPELADLVDLTVLVDAPIAVRHARLTLREEADFLEAWHARWDEAEVHYFTHVRPREAFDWVVAGG